ncbi:MAG: AraC family transcriptional regulator [Prevotella sp.]|nr:AraC family transcriptional regulator [Prevotella sp.]
MSPYQAFLFHTLFACVATLAFAASLYLLLRRSNGIAPDIDPPVRLRRWTAAFFAAAGASHLWWLFIRYGPMEGDLFDRILLCSALDTVSTAPLLLCTMLVMLQDRRRPLWPIAVMSALTSIYILLIYILGVKTTAFLIPPALLIFIFSLVLARAVRQYDRWLLDNYADLEHKEARISIGVMVAFVLISVVYGFANDYFFFEVLIEVANIPLIVLLLWRVETTQTLTDAAGTDAEGNEAVGNEAVGNEAVGNEAESNDAESIDAEDAPGTADSVYLKLESLLQQHCVDRQYYLQHDASLTQLAKMLGTNRNYLSQHFTLQGQTYNSYINSLRIQHFIRLYEESIRNGQPIAATELATRCGFRSYSTFSRAFKQIVGHPVAEWMEEKK